MDGVDFRPYGPQANSAACFPGIYFKTLNRSSTSIVAVLIKYSADTAYRGGVNILPFAFLRQRHTHTRARTYTYLPLALTTYSFIFTTYIRNTQGGN